MIKKELGRRLRLIRNVKGLSQENMAEGLGITQSAYAQIETGRTDINISRLESIAKIFQLSVAEILTFGDNSELNIANEPAAVYQRRGLIEAQKELAVRDYKEIDFLQKEVSRLAAMNTRLTEKLIGCLEKLESEK